jgi:hypothetical protein
LQVAEVLEQGEAGADGKPQHRGVDEKSDPRGGHKPCDERGLGGFFGKRRNIPRQDRR